VVSGRRWRRRGGGARDSWLPAAEGSAVAGLTREMRSRVAGSHREEADQVGGFAGEEEVEEGGGWMRDYEGEIG